MTQQVATTGFVYLIRDGDRHKIGKSIDPQTRLAQAASPAAVLVHLIPSANPFQVENALHRRFAACRASGPGREWFTLSEADVELICRLVRVDSADDLPPELQASPTVPSTVTIQARVPPELADALERACKDHERTKNQELVVALKRHLESGGFWPPPLPDTKKES